MSTPPSGSRLPITVGEIAVCVIAACVVWALIHGWG